MQDGIGTGVSTMAGDADRGTEKFRATPEDRGRNPLESEVGSVKHRGNDGCFLSGVE